MEILKEKRNNSGYAILFTVVIVGIISMITIGLSNAVYKQIMLSSVAKDSITAFYQADIASDCALYADKNSYFEIPARTLPFNCGGYNLYITLNSSSDGNAGKYIYNVDLSQQDLDLLKNKKCFNAVIMKIEVAI